MNAEVIEIEKEHILTGTGHSSKGNQLKWKVDGYWYKADAFGFESLSEVVISRLLQHSNIKNFVEYEPVTIIYKGKSYRGCRSKNFRRNKEELVTLERLSRQYTGFSLARELGRISDIEQRILYVTELVENVTGLEGFGEYLSKMLEIDAFFLNEDRHTNNIALLYDSEKKEYGFCPFFDMGLSLFSDTREAYPIEKDFEDCRKTIAAKPFSRDFDEQMDAAEQLFGSHLKFYFSEKTMADILGELQTLYRKEEIERVEGVLRNQMRKYQYMFAL
ncbi:MAG: hypothetical protein HDR00_13460 [Lachnospiraceae bacterium]|nr:hypothetical protein [Lachnospiraceae bacterium]